MFEHIRPHRYEPHPPDFTRASQELLEAAEHDAGEIVSIARADVQRRVLKAQQELLALNAQVRTAMNRLQGGPDGNLLERSLVLREARRELDALSGDQPSPKAEPRPITMVPVDGGRASVAGQRPMLSPYEMDNPRVRVRVPARAARTVKAVPVASTVLVIGLAAGIWGWSHGWRIVVASPQARLASDAPADQASPNGAPPQATGMIGRTEKAGATPPPSRPRPADDAKPLVAAAPAGASSLAQPSGGTTAAGRQELLGAAGRWLEAYYVKDAAGLSALSTPTMSLSDERTQDERLPPGLTDVRRSLSDATVQVFGSDAILTAKLSERDASGRESSGFVSQMWTRRSGAWQVTDVRIVSAAAVARAFKR